MKILKKGKWSVPWTRKATCPSCGAELVVEEQDIKPTYNAWKYHCACADCGTLIDLDPKDFPPRLKEAVDKKRKWHMCSE